MNSNTMKTCSGIRSVSNRSTSFCQSGELHMSFNNPSFLSPDFLPLWQSSLDLDWPIQKAAMSISTEHCSALINGESSPSLPHAIALIKGENTRESSPTLPHAVALQPTSSDASNGILPPPPAQPLPPVLQQPPTGKDPWETIVCSWKKVVTSRIPFLQGRHGFGPNTILVECSKCVAKDQQMLAMPLLL